MLSHLSRSAHGTGSYGANWICNSQVEPPGNISFPVQCDIDDQTHGKKTNGILVSSIEDKDIISSASLIQKISQENSYGETMQLMNEMN